MKKNKKIIVFAAAVLLAALLTAKADVSIKGASSALTLCARVLIPSLFPFMVLCAFTANLTLGGAAQKILSPVMRLLFNQSAAAAPVVLMSLVGGYPVGARMARTLLERNEITAEQAGRLMLFCVNAGPAFVIGSVGTAMLSSARAGAVLYSSLLISSIVLGVLSRFAAAGDCLAAPAQAKPESHSISQNLALSVSDASSGILSVCAWVILFGAVCALAKDFLSGKYSVTALLCVLEVTGGCNALAGNFPLPVIAAALGFGGLCVHCQIFSAVKSGGVSPALFFTSRVINAVFAAFICSALEAIFPCTVEAATYAGQTSAEAWSVSAPAAAALLFLCSLVILDLDTKEKV